MKQFVGSGSCRIVTLPGYARRSGVAPVPAPGQIGLRRALVRRHNLTVDPHRTECRLWALAIPDVWRACGGHTLAQPILDRWRDLRSLSRAPFSSVPEIVAAHSRDSDPVQRAERIQQAARGWHEFWLGRLDLAWEIGELVDDMAVADQRQAGATAHALAIRQHRWPDDLLLTIPGVGPVCASATHAEEDSNSPNPNTHKISVGGVGWWCASCWTVEACF
ncbi:MAG: hypothetical protein GY708_10200 [Actinomycetia bacterium]|nr:hypothetical protein [Actinomycetes bacterium]